MAGEFLDALKPLAGQIDGAYFRLHGSMGTPEQLDPEGYLLQETRKILGDELQKIELAQAKAEQSQLKAELSRKEKQESVERRAAEKQYDALLKRAAYRSRRQIEELVAELVPRPAAPAAMRKPSGVCRRRFE